MGKSQFQTVDKVHGMAVDFSLEKCHKPSVYLGLSHFFCYNRSIKVGDGDCLYDDF